MYVTEDHHKKKAVALNFTVLDLLAYDSSVHGRAQD